jgi:hypothetical protein
MPAIICARAPNIYTFFHIVYICQRQFNFRCFLWSTKGAKNVLGMSWHQNFVSLLACFALLRARFGAAFWCRIHDGRSDLFQWELVRSTAYSDLALGIERKRTSSNLTIF